MAAKDLYEKDYYGILGVDKSADGEEIKKRYPSEGKPVECLTCDSSGFVMSDHPVPFVERCRCANGENLARFVNRLRLREPAAFGQSRSGSGHTRLHKRAQPSVPHQI